MEIRISHPKHGFHVVYSEAEVTKHAENGWVKHVVEELSLVDKYKAKFGKAPHHMMKPETIQKALDDNSK
jgi:hypothetical protein